MDNIFDDDTDIFSDVSTLTTKKKPDETTPKKKTETIAATTKPAVKTNTNKRGNFIFIINVYFNHLNFFLFFKIYLLI